MQNFKSLDGIRFTVTDYPVVLRRVDANGRPVDGHDDIVIQSASDAYRAAKNYSEAPGLFWQLVAD